MVDFQPKLVAFVPAALETYLQARLRAVKIIYCIYYIT